MHVPLSLLNRFFKHPISLSEILEACDRIGVEIFIPSSSNVLSSVVSAKIISTLPHPNSDRLRIAQVFDGDQTWQVVCGAPNCRPDIIIPFAKIGAVLPDPDKHSFKIKKSKIRDIESFGMCCGADEIGYPHLQNEDGLLELPVTTPLGEDISVLLNETILELSLTPNLGHCASLYGLAREIAFCSKAELNLPEDLISTKEYSILNTYGSNEPDLCPLYVYAKVSNVSPIPSPKDLQDKLLSLKIKPINAIVDITNYIMFCLGQPLHTYDANHVDTHSLNVRLSTPKETITLLNNQNITLPEGLLLVCDQNNPLALAGIMGSLQSSITENTQSIILESAFFNPSTIRLAQKHTSLHTEAAYRFVRGTDPKTVLPALKSALQLLSTVFPNAEISTIVTKGDTSYVTKNISVRKAKVNQLLGTSLSSNILAEKLSSLGFQSLEETFDTVTVDIPSYRHDINEEVDLIEEVARTEESLRASTKSPNRTIYSEGYSLEKQIKPILTGSGLLEFYTCDLLDPEMTTWSEESPEISLLGSKHATALRHSLLPGLLKSTALNLNRQSTAVQAFEIGKTYHKNVSYQEKLRLGIILAGNAKPLSWQNLDTSTNFFILKGIIEKLLNKLGIRIPLIEKPSANPNFHPYQQTQLFLKHDLGILGMVHPTLRKKADIKIPVFFAELSLDVLLKYMNKKTIHYKPYPIYPGSFRDFTISVPLELPASILINKLSQSKSKWLESVSLVSIYQNKDVDLTQKSVSLRLNFQNKEKTLSNEEIDQEYNLLIASLMKQLEQENFYKE